jgi:hypothetical protein
LEIHIGSMANATAKMINAPSSTSPTRRPIHRHRLSAGLAAGDFGGMGVGGAMIPYQKKVAAMIRKCRDFVK